MAIVEDKREKMANQLLMRGWATMKEILTVPFGEWPPHGLDINSDIPHDQIVKLQTTDANISGRALSDERTVLINKIKCDEWGFGIYPTMGHEGVHELQFDYGPRAEEIFGSDLGKKVNGGQRERACVIIMNQLLDYDSGLKHDFNKVSQDDREWVRKYRINSGYEVQVRIHVILSEAYQDWKNMPQNRDELWQALASSGLAPPTEVAQHLKGLPANSGTGHFKHRSGYSQSEKELQAIDELGMVRRTLSKQGELMFWNETLPALYADLIEMYGDRLGRERFGLGVNTTAQVQQAAFGKKPSPAQGL